MKNLISSKATALANQIRKSGLTLSEAFSKAWKIVKLQAWLRKGGEAVIRFFKDGCDIPEQRVAVAMSGNYEAKGTSRKANPMQVSYFDLSKGQVRSFNAARFAEFVTV